MSDLRGRVRNEVAGLAKEYLYYDEAMIDDTTDAILALVEGEMGALYENIAILSGANDALHADAVRRERKAFVACGAFLTDSWPATMEKVKAEAARRYKEEK